MCLPEARVAVVSISLAGYDPQELAVALDAAFGVQVRAGLHLRPRPIDRSAPWPREAHCVISPGPLTSEEEIQTAVNAVAEVAAQSPVV